jgi:carbonic anhydrase
VLRLTARRQWAAEQRERDPEFFNRLMSQQNPEYLWIGCSDSRVPVSVPTAAPCTHAQAALA